MREKEKIYFTLVALNSLGISFIFSFSSLYVMSKGVNIFQLGLLNAVYFITAMIFNLPTGLFADIISRKLAVVIAFILWIIAMLAYSFANFYWQMVVAEICFALGTAFFAGSIEGWVLDNASTNEKNDTQKLFTREQQIRQMASIFGAVIGAIMADYSMRIPWLVGAGVFLVGFYISLFHMKKDTKNQKIKSYKKEFTGVLKTGMSYFTKDKTVRWAMIIGGIAVFTTRTMDTQWQIWFSHDLPKKIQLGALFCLVSSCTILGGSLANKFQKKNVIPYSLVITGVGMICSVALSFPISVMFFLFHEVGRGLFCPTRKKMLNGRLESNVRSTALSLDSVIFYGSGACGAILSGFISKTFSIGTAWLIFGIFMIIFGVIFRHKTKDLIY